MGSTLTRTTIPTTIPAIKLLKAAGVTREITLYGFATGPGSNVEIAPTFAGAATFFAAFDLVVSALVAIAGPLYTITLPPKCELWGRSPVTDGYVDMVVTAFTRSVSPRVPQNSEIRRIVIPTGGTSVMLLSRSRNYDTDLVITPNANIRLGHSRDIAAAASNGSTMVSATAGPIRFRWARDSELWAFNAGGANVNYTMIASDMSFVGQQTPLAAR